MTFMNIFINQFINMIVASLYYIYFLIFLNDVIVRFKTILDFNYFIIMEKIYYKYLGFINGYFSQKFD